MSTEPILAFVLERLPKPDDRCFTERLEEIAKGADVPYHTLLKIAKGETVDPRVSTVQGVYDYLKGREERAAA